MSRAACRSSWWVTAGGPVGVAADDRSWRLPVGVDDVDGVDCHAVAVAVTRRDGPSSAHPRVAEHSSVTSGFWDDGYVAAEAVELASMLRGLALLVDEVLSVDHDPARAAISAG
ncbi:MAG: hypothetical protein ABI746_05860 [Dermatophilaceae bacterium]